MAKITEISWENFEALSLEEKKTYLQRGEGDTMPYHTLFAQQFDRSLLERLCALSNRIRFINKSKEGALYLKSVLAHKRAMLYFSQPSSRTFLSHLAACQLLGYVHDFSGVFVFWGKCQCGLGAASFEKHAACRVGELRARAVAQSRAAWHTGAKPAR